MARRIALINMKGGVGKSTLVANLAWEMATAPWNKSVLVVDLDPQFNCSQYLIGANRIEAILANEHPTIWNIFEQITSVPGKPSAPIDPSDTVVDVYSGRQGSIDLIPSQLELSQSLSNPTNKDRLLDQAISELEEAYDLVLIDCAPTESMLTAAAYLIAEHLLIPLRPEFLSTIGLPLLEQSLDNFAALYPERQPAVLGLVFNAISGYSPEETTSKTEVRRVAHKSGWPIFDAEVTYSKSFPASARKGRPIFSTPYARSTTKINFHNFAKEFAERIGI